MHRTIKKTYEKQLDLKSFTPLLERSVLFLKDLKNTQFSALVDAIHLDQECIITFPVQKICNWVPIIWNFVSWHVSGNGSHSVNSEYQNLQRNVLVETICVSFGSDYLGCRGVRKGGWGAEEFCDFLTVHPQICSLPWLLLNLINSTEVKTRDTRGRNSLS